MKKTLLTLIGLFIIISSTFSQKGISLSIEGSLLSTSISNDNTWSWDPYEIDSQFTFGNTFGLELGYNFNNTWGVYTGYGILTLGQNYMGYDRGCWDRKIKLNYNHIPLMLKYNGKGNKVRFIASTGFLIAILRQAEQMVLRDDREYHNYYSGGAYVIEDPIINPDGTYIIHDEAYYNARDAGAKDVTDRFKKIDLILNIEAGARFNMRNNLYLDALANFGYGLTDINTEERKLPDGKTSHNMYAGIKLRFGLNALWDKTK